MYITHAYIRLSPFPCFVPLGSIHPSSPSSSPRGRLQEAHVKGRDTLAAASKASLPRAVAFLGDWERGVFFGGKNLIEKHGWNQKNWKYQIWSDFCGLRWRLSHWFWDVCFFKLWHRCTVQISWEQHIYMNLPYLPQRSPGFGFGSKCNTQRTTDFSLDLVLTCINHPFLGGYPILTQPWPWDRSRLLCKNRIDLQHLQCSKCFKKNCGKCWETNILLGRFKSWTKDNDC